MENVILREIASFIKHILMKDNTTINSDFPKNYNDYSTLDISYIIRILSIFKLHINNN